MSYNQGVIKPYTGGASFNSIRYVWYHSVQVIYDLYSVLN